MALLNIFKKREEVKKEKTKETPKAPVVGALSLPHISEKAGMLQAQNQYVFKVVPGATKHGVKESVEEQYGVLVKKVAMIKVRAKSIRVGRNMGKKPGYKKAIVTLKEGHTIEASA